MTFTYLLHLSEIICLNTFSKLLSFVHVTSKLNILSNYAKHPKKLVLCYTLPSLILTISTLTIIYIMIFYLFISLPIGKK